MGFHKKEANMKNKKHFVLLASTFLACSSIVPVVAKESTKLVDAMAATILKQEEQKSIKLTFPIKGEEVKILKPAVVKYIAAMKEQAKSITKNDYTLHDFYITGGSDKGTTYENDTDKVDIRDYWDGGTLSSKSKKVSLIFDTKGFGENQVYKVVYGLKDNLSDGVEVRAENGFATISNLLERKTYYWKVVAGEYESATESFNTPDGFRMITADGIQNIRDMGGRPVAGGKHIKQGLIFRGGEMVESDYQASGSTHYANLNEYNKKVMREELGIKYEFDLRGDEEANNIVNSPLYDEDHQDIEYERIPNIPAYDYFFDKITHNNYEYVARIKDMFLAFKNANEKHVYFHCWGGADRTGTVGFLLGGLLGMSYTDLIIDYELTTFANNYRPHTVNDSKNVYRFPAMVNRIMTDCKDGQGNQIYSPDKTISEMIETVLVDYVGLSKQDILDIKANLLED